MMKIKKKVLLFLSLLSFSAVSVISSTNMIIANQSISKNVEAVSLSYKYTFKKDDLKSGAGTIDLDGISWDCSIPAGTSINFDSNNGRGLQIGTGKSPAKSLSLKTTIAGKITKITVNSSVAKGGTAKLSISVGGNDTTIKNQSLTTSAADYSCSPNETGEISISWANTSKAFYVKSISIEYESDTTKKLSSLELSGTLNKNEYYDGDTIDATGLKVTATYDDGSTENVTQNVVWTPSKLTVGVTEIIGTYTYGEISKSVTYSGIIVTERLAMTEYSLVTDASTLKAGDIVTIASKGKGMAIGAITDHYFPQVAIEILENSNSFQSNKVESFVLGGKEGLWTLTSTKGKVGATDLKTLAYESGTTTWSISVANGDATVYNKTSKYGRILYNVSSNRFTTYTSSTNSNMLLPQLYRATSISYSDAIKNYAKKQNDTLECDPTGVTAPKVEKWSEIKTKNFDNLNYFEKEQLKYAKADASSDNIVEKAMAKYDFIVGKYGASSYTDYIGRNPSSLNTSNLFFKEESKNNALLISMVLVTFVGVATTGLLFLKRKKA